MEDHRRNDGLEDVERTLRNLMDEHLWVETVGVVDPYSKTRLAGTEVFVTSFMEYLRHRSARDE